MLNKLFKIIKRITPTKWHWILNHGGFRRYFANTGWMFLGQMMSLLASFFVGAWIARYLGPEDYGIVNYVVAFVGIFGFISGLGVDNVLSREIIKNPEKENELMGTGMILKVIGGFLTFLVILITNFLIPSNTIIRLFIFIYSLFFLIHPFLIISIYFQAKVQGKNSAKAQIFTLILSSVLKILFIFFGVGLIWLIIIYLLDIVWQAVFLISIYLKNGNKFSLWRFNKGLAKNLLRDGWPLILSTAATYIYLKVDQVMIGRMLGNTEVGLYSAAVKLAEIWYFVPTVMLGSLFPAIVNAKKVSSEIYHRRLKNLYFFMVIIALIIASVMTLLAKYITILLFGPSYLMSIPILQIYIWSGIGLFLGWTINHYLLAENLTKIIFLSNLLITIINISLNFILISKIGLNGAAIATLISYLALPIAMVVFKKFSKNKLNNLKIS